MLYIQSDVLCMANMNGWFSLMFTVREKCIPLLGTSMRVICTVEDRAEGLAPKYAIRCHYRADFRFAPSQWETALLCNDVSHWLGASIESVLRYRIRIHKVYRYYFRSASGTLLHVVNLKLVLNEHPFERLLRNLLTINTFINIFCIKIFLKRC